MEHAIAIHLVIVLAVGTALVALFQSIGLSPILGYLATGVLAGPFGFNWLPADTTTHLLAELGVVLLMFTIGLEFSLPRLLAARNLVLGLGSAQVVLTTLLLALVGWWLGLIPAQAFIVGAALAMSSTAIVLKQLGEQLELPTSHGRIATGILLFQDIAAVFILVVLPVLAADPARLTGALVLALAMTALVFSGLVFVGRHLLSPVLHWVASTRSLELFMLTALLLALAAAAVSDAAGLSPTLGSFMAGMLLGETVFRHQVEADIRPFRDLMLGLFFATIGMQLDPAVFIGMPAAVALILAALVAGKAVILMPLVRAFGYTDRDAIRAAISLAQGGEFGLLVISSSFMVGLLERNLAQPVLAGVILSMVLAPLVVRFNGRISEWMNTWRHAEVLDIEEKIAEASSDFNRHVIICGYGRLGQNVVRILSEEGIAALALDLDPERIRQATAAGEPVLFGNVAQPGVLRAAGIERALALAITIDDVTLAARIVSQLRVMGIELPVLVRSTRGRDDEALSEAGATVFPEGLENSLAYAGQLLLMLDVPPSKVEVRLNCIRAEDYAPLRVFFHDTAQAAADEQSRDYPEEVHAIVVTDAHHAAGRTPHELGLLEKGVELIDVRRGAIRVPGRLLDTRLRAGDVLLLKGDREALAQAVALLADGA